jgi:hypothetical protein
MQRLDRTYLLRGYQPPSLTPGLERVCGSLYFVLSEALFLANSLPDFFPTMTT